MDELLGFVVLTGPLLPILIWLVVSILLTKNISKRIGRVGNYFMSKALMFSVIFVVPFVDEIAGQVYLSYLCKTHAGSTVYQTVELPTEYWDESGMLKLKTLRSNTPGVLGLVEINNSYFEERPLKKSHNEFFNIDKVGFELRSVDSKELVGKIVYFRYWHGWFIRNFSANNSAISCKDKKLDDWDFGIFITSTDK